MLLLKVIGNYIADIIVEDKIILELKAIEKINSIHMSQLHNYLKATNLELGILINFGNSILYCQTDIVHLIL